MWRGTGRPAVASHVNAKQLAVEIGARDGIDISNTHRLDGLGRQRGLFDTAPYPGVIRVHVTAETVGSLLAEPGAPVGSCVRSIDIDGNDYWVLKAMLGPE
jgi:hypothetical protein